MNNIPSIDELVTRGVDKIYPDKQTLIDTLQSGKKLTIYQGFDPTGTRLHIGHAVGFMKLRQFQLAGHKIILLIGDFTGMIGDPSGKSESRKPLTREQVLENAGEYKQQVTRILDFEGDNPVEIRYNSEWNSKLSFDDVLKLAANFTAQQMIERDMFQERIKAGKEINLVEFLYPLVQGYDSVAMDVDMEVGGTDQTFNMLAGRKLLHQIKRKEKFVLTVPLLTDKDGRKIGKTTGNVIGITDQPDTLYGEIMSLPDSVLEHAFEYLTPLPMEQVQQYQQQLKDPAVNPMQLKKELAKTLVAFYNSPEAADMAQKNFEHVHQQQQTPDNPLPVSIKEQETLTDIIAEHVTGSKSQARRLLSQKAVDINGEVVTSDKRSNDLPDGAIIKIGKKNFLKIQK